MSLKNGAPVASQDSEHYSQPITAAAFSGPVIRPVLAPLESETPQQLLERARAKRKSGQFKDAFELGCEALLLNPGDLDTMDFLADLRARMTPSTSATTSSVAAPVKLEGLRLPVQNLARFASSNESAETRLARIKKMRLQLNFDLTNGCNINCIMCGNVPNKTRATQYVMPQEVFENSLLPVFGFAQDFSYGCYFEPLMTPYFDEALPRLAQHLVPGIRGDMITNAVLLTEARAQMAVDANVFKKIRVSVDGATAKTFEEIRKGSRFNRVIENVRNLAAYRDSKGSDLEIEFNFTKMRQNIHELPDVVKLAHDCGVTSVSTHKLAPDDCRPIDKAYYDRIMYYVGQARNLARELGIAYSGQDDYEVIAADATPKPSLEKTEPEDTSNYVCEFSKKWLLVTLDPWGNVSIPCKRTLGKLGNITRQSFRDLLISDVFAALLAGFDAPEPSVCRGCIYHRPLKG